jgi:hypothetical protein
LLFELGHVGAQEVTLVSRKRIQVGTSSHRRKLLDWYDERVTAYHEAGHAVVGTTLFGNFASVDILPTDERLGGHYLRGPGVGDYALSVMEQPGPRERLVWRHARRRCIGHIWHCMAGYAAESILQGRRRPLLFGEHAAPDDAEPGDDIWQVHEAARLVMMLDDGGDAERADTARMGEVWRTIITPEWRRLRPWVREHWAHVAAVAAALLAHRHLDAERFYGALERLPPPRHPRFWVESLGRPSLPPTRHIAK